MVMIYTSIECENDSKIIVKNYKNSEILKVQNFGHGRSVEQNDPYFRS